MTLNWYLWDPSGAPRSVGGNDGSPLRNGFRGPETGVPVTPWDICRDGHREESRIFTGGEAGTFEALRFRPPASLESGRRT